MTPRSQQAEQEQGRQLEESGEESREQEERAQQRQDARMIGARAGF
jgi:hypothetical protein